MRKSAAMLVTVIATLGTQPQLAAQSAAPTVISVELSNFKFSPSELTLRHGQTYHLHLVNQASGGHDFSAPEFFAASNIAASDRGSIVDGRVKLAGHATIDLTLTPEKAGAYTLRCTHFMHSGMGMSGRIVVE